MSGRALPMRVQQRPKPGAPGSPQRCRWFNVAAFLLPSEAADYAGSYVTSKGFDARIVARRRVLWTSAKPDAGAELAKLRWPE